MMKIKHLMDPTESDDGLRLFVEPYGLTLDLREWCDVTEVWSHLGPPRKLHEWFEEHPDGYDYFRAQYHEAILAAGQRSELLEIARHAGRQNITLLHMGDDPAHNTATALYEFIAELEAYCPPE